MEQSERRKKLMESVKKFNKDNKSEVFTLGSEIEDTPVIPFGIPAVDDFIGGGVKRGGHTIVYGQFSVGKTALIMHLVASAQHQGLNVCYVNTEKPISPDRFRFFGVDLDTLLYIEAPENAELALEALRTLCKDKVIDLFIIDSTNGLCPASVQSEIKGGQETKERGLIKRNVAALPMTLSNFYNIVNAQIYRAKAAVVWIGQLRTKGIGSYITMDGLTGGNSQLFFAYQIIRLRKGQKADNPKAKIANYSIGEDGKVHKKTEEEDIGFGVVAKLDKTNSSKSLKEGSETQFPFYYESGFKELENKDDQIVILGTEEEKKIIILKLIEKGILVPKSIQGENETVPDNLTITCTSDYDKPLTVPYPSEKVQEKLEEVKQETKKRGRKNKK